ncbi:hypothetical protein C7C46_07145 [Streptomyces tateyamensis]|uniref:Uncharacterized protein n=1 Tax=Streptomyces tateyamensis TaxID=565073 RepID=A0A2V4P4E5_9ACTN|nr:hypothetical protein [Streptomyces tateyamensis]PYC84683.1 hypothetical protein C7C46_07145 [Streptomyces tateyamensis]
MVEDEWPADGSSYRAPQACPLCGGELRAVQPACRTDRTGSLLVKVFVPGRMFARSSEVEGVACRVCGHLLLFVAHPEVMDEPAPKKRRWRSP